MNQSNSANVSSNQLSIAGKSVNMYMLKYRSRLNGKNLYYINLLMAVITSLQNGISRIFAVDIDSVASVLPSSLATPSQTPSSKVFFSFVDSTFHAAANPDIQSPFLPRALDASPKRFYLSRAFRQYKYTQAR